MFSFPNIKNSCLHIEQCRLAPAQIYIIHITAAEKVDVLKVPGFYSGVNTLTSHFIRPSVQMLVNTNS